MHACTIKAVGVDRRYFNSRMSESQHGHRRKPGYELEADMPVWGGGAGS